MLGHLRGKDRLSAVGTWLIKLPVSLQDLDSLAVRRRLHQDVLSLLHLLGVEFLGGYWRLYVSLPIVNATYRRGRLLSNIEIGRLVELDLRFLSSVGLLSRILSLELCLLHGEGHNISWSVCRLRVRTAW